MVFYLTIFLYEPIYRFFYSMHKMYSLLYQTFFKKLKVRFIWAYFSDFFENERAHEVTSQAHRGWLRAPLKYERYINLKVVDTFLIENLLLKSRDFFVKKREAYEVPSKRSTFHRLVGESPNKKVCHTRWRNS